MTSSQVKLPSIQVENLQTKLSRLRQCYLYYGLLLVIQLKKKKLWIRVTRFCKISPLEKNLENLRHFLRAELNSFME